MIERPHFNVEILICEDSLHSRRAICEQLEGVGIQTVVAENGKLAVELVKDRKGGGKKPFDLVFMDSLMPVMDGVRAASLIKAISPETPIVLMVCSESEEDGELHKANGIYEVISKPSTVQQLWSCLIKHLKPLNIPFGGKAEPAHVIKEMRDLNVFSEKQEKSAGNSILIVEDEKVLMDYLIDVLEDDYRLYTARSGREAVIKAGELLPDLILLDIVMPGMDGFEVISELKKAPGTSNIPVIFTTGLCSYEDEERGLALGAADYITKPFSSGILKLRISNQIQMQNLIKTIELMSTTDQLTGIRNRRSFDYRLALEWGRAVREKTQLSILIADIDEFTVYNDTYGHIQGDKALRAVARTIAGSLNRSSDFVARLGGKVFAILLPGTDLKGAAAIAEMIRTNIEALEIRGEDETVTRATISVGVNSLIPGVESSCDKFMSVADKELFKAKAAGRNRVCYLSHQASE